MSYLKARDIETNPRSVADYWSPTSQQLVADRSQGNFSWQLVANQALTFADVSSATSRRSFGNLCNQFSRGQSSVHVQKTARD